MTTKVSFTHDYNALHNLELVAFDPNTGEPYPDQPADIIEPGDQVTFYVHGGQAMLIREGTPT